MATATANKVNDPDEIRRRMAQIRQRLHQDMQGVVAGAEAASDWKHYVRLYPWAALGAALAIGYLVVPRKRRSVTRTAEKAAEAAIAKVTEGMGTASSSLDSAAKAVISEPPKAKKGWIGTVFSLATPLLLKTAQGYALSYVENWIAQQQAAVGPAPSSGPVPGSGFAPGAGPNPGPGFGRSMPR